MQRHQVGLEKAIKSSNFVFDEVDGLHYQQPISLTYNINKDSNPIDIALNKYVDHPTVLKKKEMVNDK